MKLCGLRSPGQSVGSRERSVLGKNRGFSLLEMMIVVALMMIVASIAFISLGPMRNQVRLDNAYQTTMSVLRNARQNAVDQRKRYIVTFTAPRTIQVSVWGYVTPPNPQPPPQLINTFQLPQDVSFIASGLPSPGPDAFGTGIVAIDFGQGLGAGNLNYVVFLPDGSSQDTLGNFNSGVVYFARNADTTKSRAVTVWGATGRIRGWGLNAGTWRQQ